MKPQTPKRYFASQDKAEAAESDVTKSPSHELSTKQDVNPVNRVDPDGNTEEKQQRTRIKKKQHDKKAKKNGRKRGPKKKDEPEDVDDEQPKWMLDEEIDLYEEEEFRSIENRSDPFEGKAPIAKEKIQRYERGKKNKIVSMK